MSDEEVTTKRGRKPTEVTKRPKKDAAKVESDASEDAPPVKRGRGRPKGSSKKKADKPKSNGTVGRRGRSKKEESKDSAEENGDKSTGEEDEDEED